MSLPKKIFIAGVGGQGTITATIIIGEAAISAGLNVVTSELHGMSQRGGVVVSEVLVGDVHSATIPDGTADVLLGFEPVETLRSVPKANRERTTVILNTRPIVPVTAVPGAPPYPAVDDVRAQLAAASKRIVSFDAVDLAARAGTPKAVGAVLLGALAGLEELPIARDCWHDALTARAPARFRDANLAAFDLGFRAAHTDEQ